MRLGIYSDISNADYQRGEGVSKSMLDVIAQKSPLHLHYQRTVANDNERPQTQSMIIGTAFHALLLEPELFARDYCLPLRPQDVKGGCIESKEQLLKLIEGVNSFRQAKLSTSGTKKELIDRITDAIQEVGSKDNKATLDLFGNPSLSDLKNAICVLNETRLGHLSTSGTMQSLAQSLRDAGMRIVLWDEVKSEWLENNSQKIVLKQEDWDMLNHMRDAVMAHPIAKALLTGKSGSAEQSIYWINILTGELCRCRPDFLRADNVIIDVKTTDDASPSAFAASVAKYRYHVQEAFYLDGVAAGLARENRLTQQPRFVFLVVEKGARVVNGEAMGVAVYSLDDDAKKLGRALYRRDLEVYAQCKQSGKWPCYGEKIQSLSVPAYEINRHAALIDAA